MKEIDLMQLVIEVDDELIREGKEPFQRPFLACHRVVKRLNGYTSSMIWHDPLFDEVDKIYKKLYRPSDLYLPPVHMGAFMFRDVFFPLRIPLIYGKFKVNPVDFLIDIPDISKQWLFNDQQTGLKFLDQVIDLMDFAYGLDDLEKTDSLPGKTLEWWFMAKQQMEAAAATILGSFNKYAIIQNCYISTELLIKGSLYASGIDENILKNQYGHNLKKSVKKMGEILPNIDKNILLFVVQQLPDYAKSRYEAIPFSRQELGRLLMNTQFISGEILRQFSDRDFRTEFGRTPNNTWDVNHRTFPKKR